MSIRRLFAAVLLFLLTVPARAEEPFVDKSFDEACAEAKKGGKMVLIDFYTTWCGPCKKLDRETWPNAKVKELLKEKFVAIKIDAEKDKKTADKFKVNVYPTILLAKADGTEHDRITGFQSPDDMVSDIKDALAGKDSIERARAKSKDGKNSASARMHVGDAYKAKGQYDKALEEYMWCFDHGLENDRAFYGVRLSFLLGSIMDLANVHPPALEALKKRRDDAGTFVLEYDSKKLDAVAREASASGNPVADKIHDFTSLNKTLNDQDRNIQLFDALRKKADADPKAMDGLFEEVIPQLVEAKRYADVADRIKDPVKDVERRIAQAKDCAKQMAGINFPGKDEFLERQQDRFVDEVKYVYESLIGTKRLEEATKVGMTILDFDDSPRSFEVLVRSALRAKGKAVAEPIVARAKKELSAADYKRIKPTLDRIPTDD